MQNNLTLRQLRAKSHSKIQRMQNKRFHATCSVLLPQIPFYKKLLNRFGVDPNKLKKVEDWQKQGLPLIKKSTYLKNPKEFIVKPNKEKIFSNHINYLKKCGQYKEILTLILSKNKQKILKNFYKPQMLVFSGGTESDNPAPIFLTHDQKFHTLMPLLKELGTLIMSEIDGHKKTGMNLFPYAPHLGWHIVHHAIDINCDLNLNTAAGGALSSEKLVAIAGKFKPTVICAMSDYLKNRFLPLAIKNGITLPRKLLYINGAQKMVQEDRIRIKKLFAKVGAVTPTILDFYSASELKEAILPEVFENSGFYHLAPLQTIIKCIEVKKTTKEFITDYEFSDSGQMVSWNIDGAGSILHGYVIGDSVGRIETTKCPKTNLNVKRFYDINRTREVTAQIELTGTVEEKIKGTKINLVAIRQLALQIKSIIEVQVVASKNTLELKYVTNSKVQSLKGLKKAFKLLEVKIKLTKTTLKELKGDKLKFEAIKLI